MWSHLLEEVELALMGLHANHWTTMAHVKSHIKVYRLYNEFNSTQVLPYHRLFRNFIYNYHIRCIAGESEHINRLTYTHKQAIRLAAWHRYTTFLLFLEWNIALFTQDGTLHQYSTFHMHDLTF